MYESTINQILKKDKKSTNIFLKTFAFDEKPLNFDYPASFIINTEPRTKHGQHWLAFYYDKKGYCYFFDSYGKHPSFYKLLTYINQTSIKWTYNKQRVQGMSPYCGFYCVLFLLFMVRKKLDHFFSKFTKNWTENDNFILNNLKKFN